MQREWNAPHSGCQKAAAGMRDIRRKLSPAAFSLQVMNPRNPSARRATWRDRFLEIARQVEGIEARTGRALAAGLRPRARMAGFATLRRALVR